MNSDLISRQAVIDMLDKWILRAKHPCNKSRYNSGEIDAYESVVCDIVELPPAEQEQKWIPVSERLPEKEKRHYWVCTDTGYQCQCRWTNDVYGFGASDRWNWKIFDIPQYQKVVAWMPLPKPYKENKEMIHG